MGEKNEFKWQKYAPNFDNHIYKEINIKSLKMLAKINVFKSLERLKKMVSSTFKIKNALC